MKFRFDKDDFLFALVGVISIATLLYMISGSSISYHEAMLLKADSTPIARLSNLSIAHLEAYIGRNFAYKLPNLAFHALNLILIYLISNRILKFKRDCVLCVGVYALIPGVIMQGSIVNTTTMMLTLTLFICLLELKTRDLRDSIEMRESQRDSKARFGGDSKAIQKRDLVESHESKRRFGSDSILDSNARFKPQHHKLTYPLMLLATLMGQSASVLFVALFFYALSNALNHANFLTRLNLSNRASIANPTKREFWSKFFGFFGGDSLRGIQSDLARFSHILIMPLWAIFCFWLNRYLFGIDISGRPRGQFLDIFAELALLYSPPLFVYFIYAIYRNFAKQKANILLFVSGVSIAISVLLSIRQDVNKEIYMFMSLCGIPLMVRQLLSDIRLRLPMFQESYKKRFFIVIAVLLIESSALIFAKQIYRFTSDDGIFLNQFYIAREVANELKARGISRVQIEGRMKERLAFYGIKDGGQRLRQVKKGGNILVEYNEKIVARYAI